MAKKPTSQSSLVSGPFGPLMRSQTGICCRSVKPSGWGKYGVSHWPKLNSTAQLWQRTWGKSGFPSNSSLLTLKAVPRSCPFLEKEISISAPSKFCKINTATIIYSGQTQHTHTCWTFHFKILRTKHVLTWIKKKPLKY